MRPHQVDKSYVLGLLDGIAELLGVRWPQLARKLHLLANLDNIRVDHRDSIKDQAVEMLIKWKQQLGEDARVKIIVEALIEIHFKDVADFILTRCRAEEHPSHV